MTRPHGGRRPPTSMIVATAAVVIAGAATATGASLSSTGQIRPNSITGLDIKNRSLGLRELSLYALHGLKGNRGATGPQGPTGPKGDTGPAGPAGQIGVGAGLGPAGPVGPAGPAGATGPMGAVGPPGAAGPQGPAGPQGAAGAPAVFSAANWGVIGRNSFGSPVAQLRVGPGTPPSGVGSLGLLVAGPPTGGATTDAEKVVFGTSDVPVALLAQVLSVKYQVFTDMDTPITAVTLPGINMELNPHIVDATGPISYTTLVYLPPPQTAASVWTALDATAGPGSNWFMTGRAGTASGCTLATMCSFAQVQAAVPLASLLTFGIAKGRDNAFRGAVDALQVNSTLYDFEPLGVTATPVP